MLRFVLLPAILPVVSGFYAVVRPGACGFVSRGSRRSWTPVCEEDFLDLPQDLEFSEGLELPLFDPLSDQIPFPFPAPTPTNSISDEIEEPSFYRYAFDRPAHLRMMTDTFGETDRSVVFSSDGDGPALFGHCILAGNGEVANPIMLSSDSLVRVGTVGVALRLLDVQRGGGDAAYDAAVMSGQPYSQPFGFGGPLDQSEVAVATGVGAFRYIVEEVTQTIPYPIANVRVLRDEPCAGEAEAAETAELERQVTEKIGQLVELSRKLEGKGIAEVAEAAEAALSGPEALLDTHAQSVLGAAYASAAERWECFSLGACEVINMPYADACEAVSTTSAKRRFELLLDSLNPAVSEMAAIASLDSLGGGMGDPSGGLPPDMGGLSAAAAAMDPRGKAGGSATGASSGANARPSAFGGTTAFTPIDIPLGNDGGGGGGFDIPLGGEGGGGSPLSQPEEELEVGTRLEYWWCPELQWCKATVRRTVKDKGQLLHTLEFDMDGTWEDLSLTFGDGKRRWRPTRD